MQRRQSLALATLLGIGTLTNAAGAKEVPFVFDHCFAGEVTTVSAGKTLTVFGFELVGIARSNGGESTFDNYTTHCIGAAKVVAGKPSASGFCKFMSPEEDLLVVEMSGTPTGAWNVLEGSGKWQGATGNATYERLTKSKGIKPGTVQHCYRNQGSLSTP